MKLSSLALGRCRILLILLLLPSLAQAIPLKDFIDTSLIGGGVMLFGLGLIMLVIPRMFKTGVMTMLLADVFFLSRIFMQKEVTSFIESQEQYAAVVQDLSRDAARFATVMVVISVMVMVLILRGLLRSVTAIPESASSRKKRSTESHRTATSRRPRGREPKPEEMAPPVEESKKPHRPRIDRDNEPHFSSGSASQNKFRVHDYLEKLESQQNDPYTRG